MEPHTLQHPLEEPEPVVMHHTTAGQLGLEDTGWGRETVLWTSLEVALVVTFNQVSGCEGLSATICSW